MCNKRCILPLRFSRTIILNAYIKVTGFVFVQALKNKNIRIYLRSSVDQKILRGLGAFAREISVFCCHLPTSGIASKM
jgi:hypothetical protein